MTTTVAAVDVSWQMKWAWERHLCEFNKWMGKASNPKRVVVKRGGEDAVNQLRSFTRVKPHMSEVLIVSYDLLRLNIDVVKGARQLGLLVVDEGHRLKNKDGSRTMKALQTLQVDARLLMTGTPIQNNLTEFHTVANFCCPGLLGDLASFRKEYERPINAANSKSATWSDRMKGEAQSRALEEITQTFLLRRLQKDILHKTLPPRYEYLLFPQPSLKQRLMYETLVSGKKNGATDPLVLLTSLRKLCGHPCLSGGQKSSSLEHSGKLTALKHLLLSIRKYAPQDKVVVISNFTSILDLIATLILQPNSLQFQRLDGSTAQSDRQRVVDSFHRTSQCSVMLLSSKAGGCGLNLTGANRLVMVDPDFNPATDLQAMARVYRQGQNKESYIYRLFTAGTVEEVIYQRQQVKGNLATLTVDGGVGRASGSSSFTKEELLDCFTLKHTDSDTKRKMNWTVQSPTDDTALMDVVQTLPNILKFVHLVELADKETTPPAIAEKELGVPCEKDEGQDESSSSEEEFDWDEDS